MFYQIISHKLAKSVMVFSFSVLSLGLLVLTSCQPGAADSGATIPSRTVPLPTVEPVLSSPTIVPSPTALTSQPLTLKQAFDLLRQLSGVSDLAFYGYDAFDVDPLGQSSKYTISGYSATQKRFCYIQVRPNGEIQVKSRDQDSIDAPVVENLDTLKDTPELVNEAFAKYSPCNSELHLGINLTQSQVQFLCDESGWSGEVSPYK
ncbi:MAG: hypothetical protein JXA42_17360 [Anaerolineales bacterium]|nr:hypothetical protein [Anaerolineales bacterium]